MKSLIGGIVNKTPVSYVSKGLSVPFRQQAGGNAETMMAAYGSVGTLFAIVNRVSNATAQVNWRLYRKSEDRRRRYGPMEDTRVEVTRHLALDIWNKPNPFFTRQEFVETFQQHLDLTGEGWWLASRDPRAAFPLELWPVRPDRMSPVPHPTEYLSGYVYTSPDGVKVPLALNEVIQLRMADPLDLYRGVGPVQTVLAALDSVKYSVEWNRSFFLNSAEPGGIIEYESKLSDQEFEENTARWREQHQGVGNAHRVAVIEGGKWVERKYSHKDMQFSELNAVNREMIRESFGFPKPMLGTVEDVNRANAEAAEVVFARWVVTPRLERIKQALNNDFLPLFGETGTGLEFDYDNPVPDDREADNNELVTKANAAVALIGAGFDAAQVLETVGLPPMTFSKPKPAPMPFEEGASDDSADSAA